MECGQRVGALRPEPEIMLGLSSARIAWFLDNPHASDWLKQALRTAHGLDPVVIQNDLELLRHLLIPHAQAQIEIAMTTACANPS